MGSTTKIQWATATWNPVTGCTPVSEGCQNCYARTFLERFRGVKGHKFEQGFDVRPHLDCLNEPKRWKKPQRVFVCSVSDLYHPDVTPMLRWMVWRTMRECPQHTFLVLTKRPQQMLDDLTNNSMWADEIKHEGERCQFIHNPLPNVWLGVTAENQRTADERIPLLLQCPAAVRFLSCEPLLGPVDLRHIGKTTRGDDFDALYGFHTTYQYKARNAAECSMGVCASSHFTDGRKVPRIDWVIVGGESGPQARPCDVQWIRSVISQCSAAGVPCFVKQLGANVIHTGPDPRMTWPAGKWDHNTCRVRLSDRKGGDPAEWPEDLRVQEFPEVAP